MVPLEASTVFTEEHVLVENTPLRPVATAQVQGKSQSKRLRGHGKRMEPSVSVKIQGPFLPVRQSHFD